MTPWPKLFQNLRSTRETELTETFPLHVVTSWLGNSQLIAAKHYLQVTDSHFQEATQNPTQNSAEIVENDKKPVIRPLRENEKGPEFPGLSRPISSVNFMEYPLRESNPCPRTENPISWASRRRGRAGGVVSSVMREV